MRAEKLFLLINEIDDRLIDDAERTDDSPIEIEYEPRRFPIKEIIAFAACAAVLVFGVFAVVKWRINDIDVPPDSGANSNYSEMSGELSNISETSGTSEEAEPVLAIDAEFPDITQIKLPVGSFEEKLRHIMLSAKTVEELESNIAEIDDGRVSEVSVTKKTDKIEYLYRGEPVTEGGIEDDMFVKVTLSDGVWYRYHVGYVFESSENSIYDFGEFVEGINRIAGEAETLGGFMAAVAEFDVNERLDEIHLYQNESDYESGIEITDDNTALKKGMYLYIKYDSGKSWIGFEIGCDSPIK